MPTINENLKSLRRASGMTQAEVADKMSMTRQTISSYESGRTQPDLETLKRLAEVYQSDLYDVLYGGNRLQRRLYRSALALYILFAIMLLGILTRSVLFWGMNKYMPIRPGTADWRPTFETRMALNQLAETVCGICTGIFPFGLAVMLYPYIKVIHAVAYCKLLLLFSIVLAAMLACTLPFGMSDRIFRLADYIIPTLSPLLCTFLFFAVLAIAKLIKRRAFSN